VADTAEWMRKNPHAGKSLPDGTATPVAYNGHMTVGIIALVIGVGVTAVSCVAASGGGTYIVAWGAILFGIVEILRGFGPPKRPDEPSRTE